jgi:acetyl-CoA carboxylase biotin carboxyl carrier protein
MADLTQQDVDEILRLVDASHFDELKLEIGDLKIAVRRRGAAPQVPAAIRLESAPSTPGDATKSSSNGAKANGSASPEGAHNGSEVPAPLLGTFYHAPKPGADPFVRVGDLVETETVIGIIEVMKLMNSVTAGITGTVTEIVAPNGELVEHGQTLMRVRPA